MDKGGSYLLGLVFHERRFKSNWGLAAPRTGAAALVVPGFDAGKELWARGRVLGGHTPAKDFVFDFTEGTFHPGVVLRIA